MGKQYKTSAASGFLAGGGFLFLISCICGNAFLFDVFYICFFLKKDYLFVSFSLSVSMAVSVPMTVSVPIPVSISVKSNKILNDVSSCMQQSPFRVLSLRRYPPNKQERKSFDER
ncbi:MAG: hypothetical protein PUE96_03125 [Oscillospiraceae bacterium]|nr:hypothetical protein [Oscillospiraceae bacterium]